MNNWESLKEKVDNIVIDLEVSHDNIESYPQIERLVYDKLTELNIDRKDSSLSNYVKSTKKIIYYLDKYSSYIISFKHNDNKQDYQLYSKNINQLFAVVANEYNDINKKFSNSSGIEKLGLGDCLVDACLLYLKLSQELLQLPSPEYRAKYREIIKTLKNIKQLDIDLLKNIYDLSKGEQTLINKNSLKDNGLKDIILDYLKQKRYIDLTSEETGITEKGQKIMKRQSESSGNITINNIYQVFGDIESAQLQINSTDSKQEIKK